jgi:hypothetical protein
VRDGGPNQRYRCQVAAGTISAFADRIRNAACLPDADPNPPPVVANDDDRAEGEPATTPDYLCYTCDVEHALIQIVALFPYAGFFTSSHVFSPA